MNNAKKLAILSTKSLTSHKWLYTRMSVAFAVLVFLVCLFCTYAFALNETQNDLKKVAISSNYLFSREPIDELPADTQQLNMLYYNFDNKMVDWFGVNFNFTINRADLELDGQRYGCKADDMWESISVYAGEQFWTDNDIAELHYRFGLDTVIEGRLPQNADEVVVSAVFLNWYGLNSENVIGKQLRLYVKNDANDIAIDTVTVCGVISEQFYDLQGHSIFLTPSLYFARNNALFSDGNAVEQYIYAFSNWISFDEVELYRQNYNALYVGNGVLDDMLVVENLQSVALKLFTVVGGAVGCTLILMIFLLMDKMIGVFSRDCGILLSCGIEWRQAKLLLLCLLLWVCLFAVLIAAALTVGSFYAINYVIDSYYRVEIAVAPVTVVGLFAIGLVVVLVVALTYYLYAVTALKSKTVKDLLNTQLN